LTPVVKQKIREKGNQMAQPN